MAFDAETGLSVPAVTADQMREIDRIAVEEFGLSVLQMMENAGRNLALNAVDMLGLEGVGKALPPGTKERSTRSTEIAVLAGPGGNGGGGLCSARHLKNRGFRVWVVLSKEPEAYGGAAADQLRVLRGAGTEPMAPARVDEVLRRSGLVVDALLGYSLRGAPRGRVAELIESCNHHAGRVISLDLPSGLDATTGEVPGVWIESERTLTLALPKTGLRSIPGDLYLGDIGIPPQVYQALGLSFVWPWMDRYCMRLNL